MHIILLVMSTSKLGPGVNESNDSQDTLDVLGIGRGINNESLDSYTSSELENDNNDDNNDDNSISNDVKQEKKNDMYTDCDDDDEEEEECCVTCGLVENKDFIMENAELLMRDNALCNKERRHCLYKATIRNIYGYLGREVRVPLSLCIVNRIRAMFPNEDNEEEYIGFKTK